MTHQQYAMSRVRDALRSSKGNTSEASRIIISLLKEDQTLLAGLVAPHMKGIIAHAISHVSAKKANDAEEKKPMKAPPVETGVQLAEALIDSLSGSAPVQSFGQLQEHVGKPGKASQKHIDTMHMLAGKGKTDK